MFDGTDFIVVGTSYREKCTMDRDGDFSCLDIRDDMNLRDYVSYPELFLVGSDFGKNLNKCT